MEKLVKDYNNYNNLNEVLAKVVLIDRFYSTGLNTFVSVKDGTISVIDMAEHIVKINGKKDLTEKIEKGDKEAVELIGLLNNHNNAYSFASKYCSWHNSKKYPIMDRYTKGFIYYWNKYLDIKCNYTQSDLNNYKVFCRAINDFKDQYCDKNTTFKQLDIFMWSYGKEKRLAI